MSANFMKPIFPTAIKIPETAKVVFVSDMFVEDYVGGAELTTEALISSSPVEVFKLHSKDVSVETLREGHERFWVFGNFSGLDLNLIPTIVGNMNYSVLEYDYKFCKYRSPEKHREAEGKNCDCETSPVGKFVSAFMHGAKSTWWMSERQLAIYTARFPFLADRATVLSSVFDEKFFAKINVLASSKIDRNENYVIVGSPSWIKGTDDAVEYCTKNGLQYDVVWNVPYDELLAKMSTSKGLVFLPRGSDTCPRITIEAKLLGCDLILNDNVQHKDEEWFNTDDLELTASYLYMARSRFWESVKASMEYKPRISGYTTTYNCLKQGYPFLESITSMLGFCDEVVVVDGGSQDGTWEVISNLASKEPRLVPKKLSRDWCDTRFAVFDGDQKAQARSLCTGDFCWQQDSDEIVHESDYEKVKKLARDLPRGIDILSLPVVEYWGGTSKVRMDILPWKWRLSRNKRNITHGIPAHFRRVDAEGKLYAAPGTDGCDYIDSMTNEIVPHASFYTQDVDNARRAALAGDPTGLKNYTTWFSAVISELPSVHHYSWFDIGRKIRTYRDYWSRHWQSLYDIKQDDVAENNMFFNAPWSEISERDIDNMALRLAAEMGGWIFHTRVDFNKPTLHMEPLTTHPAVMKSWIKDRSFTPDAESLNVLETELQRLLKLKGSNNWAHVRDPHTNFSKRTREYPFGTRVSYEPKVGLAAYVDLQASRSLSIAENDDVENFVQRAIGDLKNITDSDRLRLSEIMNFMGRLPVGFCEIGFRIPRLQRFFETRNIKTKGFDISMLSVVLGRSLGFDVERFDLSHDDCVDISDFELVSCYHVLEHIPDPLEAIRKIRRGMKTGSIFHVEIPLESVPNIAVAHVFPFNSGDLGEMLKLSGFDVVSTSRIGHKGSGNIERCIARAV